jgi:hypothetical protein
LGTTAVSHDVAVSKHRCQPWAVPAHGSPVGALLRCPCGRVWMKFTTSPTVSREERWRRIPGRQARRLKGAGVTPAAPPPGRLTKAVRLLGTPARRAWNATR